jgi:hypothetical protein
MGVTYLFVDTVNNKAITKITERAVNCALYNDLYRRRDDFPDEFKIISRLKDKKPFMYQIWPIPPMWW